MLLVEGERLCDRAGGDHARGCDEEQYSYSLHAVVGLDMLQRQGSPIFFFYDDLAVPWVCWANDLADPGPVAIATTGQWDGNGFGLKGGPGPDNNHAKIGVLTLAAKPYSIFGDMNQQGALSGKCSSSQTGRGGLFYVVEKKDLFNSLANLIDGDTAPAEAN